MVMMGSGTMPDVYGERFSRLSRQRIQSQTFHQVGSPRTPSLPYTWMKQRFAHGETS